MINAIRAELIKMRSMPGVWVTFGLAFPLTVLVHPRRARRARAASRATPSTSCSTLRQRRQLLGAGYFGIEVLAPIIGRALRHQRVPAQDHHHDARAHAGAPARAVAAKVVVTALWSVLIALLTLVAVAAVAPAVERRPGWT